MSDKIYKFIQEQKSLLESVSSAEQSLIKLALEIDRLQHGVNIDDRVLELIAELQPVLRKHRYSVLAPNIPVSDKKDDLIHPFCRNSHKKHTEKVDRYGADK